MQEIWIQAIGALVSIVATVLLTIRHVTNQNSKREQALLDHTEKTQSQMLDYFEKKNGHMERMADKFTSTSKELSTAVNSLATEIKVLSAKNNK